MPPVGQKRAVGTTVVSEERYAVPPDASAGKNFICVTPYSSTASASDTVAVPGRNGSPVSSMASISRGVAPGETRNAAPASRAALARSGEVTVPAPSVISGTSSAIARMASSATGVRRVSSMTGRPPATSAFATGTAWSSDSRTTTGTTGAMPSRSAARSGCDGDNGGLLGGGGDGDEDGGAGVGGSDRGAEGREQLAAGAGPLLADRSSAGGLAGVELGR